MTYLCTVEACEENGLAEPIVNVVEANDPESAALLFGQHLVKEGELDCAESVVTSVTEIASAKLGVRKATPAGRFGIENIGGVATVFPVKVIIPGRDPLLVPKAELEQVVMRVINAVSQHSAEAAVVEIRDSLDAFGLLPKESS